MVSFIREEFLKDHSKFHFSVPFRDSEIQFVSDTPSEDVVEEWGGDACFYFIEVDIEKFIPILSEYSQFINDNKNYLLDQKTVQTILQSPQNIEEVRVIEKQFKEKIAFKVPVVSKLNDRWILVWPHFLMFWLIANGVKHCPIMVSEKDIAKKIIKECAFPDQMGMCAIGASRGILPSGKISQIEAIPFHKDSYLHL